MKTTLKFRLWDKRNRCWVTDRFGISGEGFVTVYSLAGTIMDADRFVVSQYTGSNDMKGNPIFYGDFVTVGDTQYVVDLERSLYLLRGGTNDQPLGYMARFALVVGNIWETPQHFEGIELGKENQ